MKEKYNFEFPFTTNYGPLIKSHTTLATSRLRERRRGNGMSLSQQVNMVNLKSAKQI